MLFPPASSRPRPSTLIRPSVFTSALRAAILQIWPGGWVPRTMFRFTTSAVVAVPTPLETGSTPIRSEEHTSELQSLTNLVCRLLLEKKKTYEYSVLHGSSFYL